MTDAFAAANATMFADENITLEAIYTPDGGDAVSVRVVPEQPDRLTGFGGAGIVSDTAVFVVPVAAVAAPAAGDQIEVGGATYTVQGAPQRDDLQLVWRIEARPA